MDLDSVITVGGLVALNLPCLVSGMDPNSGLGRLQLLGGPFSMGKKVLRKHFSFSPRNLKKDRYHTFVTSVFNHTGPEHFTGNMITLVATGYNVHLKYGRRHLLTTFICGGISGNIAQLTHFVFQQSQLQKQWTRWMRSLGIFENSLGRTLLSWQENTLRSMYAGLNSRRVSLGASAAVSTILAIQTCRSIESVVKKFKCRENWLDNETLHEVLQVCFTVIMVYEDIMTVLDSTSSEQGLLGSFVAYCTDGIGHAAHMGGFLFGVFYYIYVLPKYVKRTR